MLVTVVFLAVTGLCLGSFLNALEWRLRRQRHREGIDDFAGDEQPSQTSFKRVVSAVYSPVEEVLDWLASPWRLLQGGMSQRHIKPDRYSIATGRSMCPQCKHQLAAVDLVPLFSWLWLRGRCRYCRKPISAQYPLIELLAAGLFVGAYLLWPQPVQGVAALQFATWLAIITTALGLGMYDAKWRNLPTELLHVLAWLTVLWLGLAVWQDGLSMLLQAALGGLIIWGLFFVIYCFAEYSDRPLIGYGDVRLAAPLGLLAGGLLPAVAILFGASLAGTLLAVYLLASMRAARDAHIPYGPFLLGATYVVVVLGDRLQNGLEQLLGLA